MWTYQSYYPITILNFKEQQKSQKSSEIVWIVWQFFLEVKWFKIIVVNSVNMLNMMYVHEPKLDKNVYVFCTLLQGNDKKIGHFIRH